MRILRFIPAFAIALSVAALPAQSPAQSVPCVSVAVGQAPPPLPTYQQPPASAPNDIWNPGYWAWGSYGYYWVAGAWVAPPAVGLYWTPGYWGYAGGGYLWNPGYWGASVGFYGGINYGFGYYGTGFVGGFWSGGAFAYNTAVTNVNRSVVRNVYYNKTVINRSIRSRSRVSFNGGHGGIHAKPSASQRVAMRERHFGRTPAQIRHGEVAGQNRNNLVAFNHGKPPVTARSNFKPLSTHDRVVAQQNALNRMRIVGANAPAKGRLVASEPKRSSSQAVAHQPYRAGGMNSATHGHVGGGSLKGGPPGRSSGGSHGGGSHSGGGHARPGR